MTFAEMKSEVRRRIDEVSPSPVFWTEAEIAAAINEGYSEISDAVEWHERWQSIDILKDRPYYDLRTTLRPDRNFLVAGPVFNETTNRWLIPVTSRELDSGDRRWEEREAEPEFFMIRGLWWLGLWPWKNIQTGTVKQYYKAIPDPMVEDDDEPGFHRTFHYGLVDYAVSDLFAQDNEPDLALAFWKDYIGYEAALKSYYEGRAGVPTVHGHLPEGSTR